MTHGKISAPYREASPPVFRRCAFNESRGANPGSLFLYSSRPSSRQRFALLAAPPSRRSTLSPPRAPSPAGRVTTPAIPTPVLLYARREQYLRAHPPAAVGAERCQWGHRTPRHQSPPFCRARIESG